MAIGKVGSFATVEPALVDFGAMAERNIDKVKADEDARRAAKAKAEKEKRDSTKDYKIPDQLGFTGIPEVDRSLQGSFRNLYSRASEAKLIGDEKTLMETVGQMNVFIAKYEELKTLMPNIAKRIESDKTLDDDAGNNHLRALTTLNQNGYEVNTDDPQNMKIALKNENGELQNEQTLDEFVSTFKVIPNKIELIDETKKVLNTIKASSIGTGNYYSNKKITDINSEESKSQVEAINNNVEMWISNDNFMYSWYKKEQAKDSKLPHKTTGWTQEQREKAKDFYTKSLIDAYNTDISIGGGRGSSGGGGSDSTLSPVVPYIYETSTQEQPAMDKFKALLPDLKGRQAQPTKSTLAKIAGKSLALAFATPGDDPKFVFQLQDTDRVGFSAGGATGGGSEAAYQEIKPGDPLYGKALSNAMAVFGVSSKKELQTLLRGETEANQRGL
jgi:hypothetical protein